VVRQLASRDRDLSCLDKGTPAERLRTQSYGSYSQEKTAELPKGFADGILPRVNLKGEEEDK